MGKRKKDVTSDEQHSQIAENQENFMRKKKKWLKRNVKMDSSKLNEDLSIKNELKNKEMEITLKQNECVQKCKKKTHVEKNSKHSNSKKIIFIDDIPQEVPAVSGTTNDFVKKKEKSFLNEDEANIKDEDIDEFCDELNDEDNVLYENWVKLIEANINKKVNKKK